MYPTPRTTRQREHDDHELTGHVVYMSWCARSLRTRAVDNCHVRIGGTHEGSDERISVGFAFLGVDDDETMAILVGIAIQKLDGFCVVQAQGVPWVNFTLKIHKV